MNRARIASLLEKQAAILTELAAEFADGEVPPAEESGPAVQPSKKVKTPPRPLTDIDRARARKSLRRMGIDLP